jgi:uncharacterized protein YjbI with pentapeptide repeats
MTESRSEEASRPGFWISRDGRKLLRQLLKPETNLSREFSELNLQAWEKKLIARAYARSSECRGRPATPRHLAQAAGVVAEELDAFRRGGRADVRLLDFLEVPEFKGKRSHLVRLLAFRNKPGAWERWRTEIGAVPDLRGAELSELDFDGLDLSHARLRGAYLSSVSIRGGILNHADLSDSDLRNTDLSYAELRNARLTGARLEEILLTRADLRNADLSRSALIGASLNGANLQGAKLTDAIVWGIASWNVRCDAKTEQTGLYVVPGLFDPFAYDERTVRHPEHSVRVNDIEVAHFISLLVQNPKIGHLIDAAADRVVLLLGRFVGSERAVLDALKERLPKFGYVPVVFDFDQPENRDTIETVSILAGLSNFVIANLSRPRSTPLEAHLVIPRMAVPFVPVIREGQSPFSMFKALQRKYQWVLPTVTYRDPDSLMRKLRKKVIEPAEKAAAQIRRLKHPKKSRPTPRLRG